MGHLQQEKYRELLTTAAKEIQASAQRHLTNPLHKGYITWLLEDDNIYQENYLRMMGVAGSIEMELHLLQKIISKEKLDQLSPYLSILNAYFAFETLSDNIGAGLSDAKKSKNPFYSAQKNILNTFNISMIHKIKDGSQSTAGLLEDCAEASQQISVHQQSLSPTQMLEFAKAYQKRHTNISVNELEYSFFSILILNIETCKALLQSLRQHPIYTLLEQSLIDRYAAVNILLHASQPLDLATAANLGSKTMLVTPTLAYCIGAIDSIAPSYKLSATIKNGTLERILFIASSLVRLLNDMGTLLLTLTPSQRLEIFSQLEAFAKIKSFSSIYDLLIFFSQQAEHKALMARLRKDLEHGEFNICLDHLTQKTSSTIKDVLEDFFNRIIFFSQLYQTQLNELKSYAESLTKQLGDATISTIIINFVTFHQVMYSHAYETKDGDYAITNTSLPKTS